MARPKPTLRFQFIGKLAPTIFLLYSLEITGAGGYWVEFSRALIRGKVSPRTVR